MIKTFEKFISAEDPYGEENWDNYYPNFVKVHEIMKELSKEGFITEVTDIEEEEGNFGFMIDVPLRDQKGTQEQIVVLEGDEIKMEGDGEELYVNNIDRESILEYIEALKPKGHTEIILSDDEVKDLMNKIGE